MADQLRVVFTLDGMQLATQALASKAQVRFTRGVASVVDWHSKTDDELKQTTALPDEAQVTTVGNIEIQKDANGVMSNDTIDVSLIFSQAAVAKDYEMRTVGLYAAPVVDGVQGKEILYNVLSFSTPQWMQQDKNGSSLTLHLATVIGDTAQLSVILADNQGGTGSGLTQAALDSLYKRIKDEVAKGYVPASSMPTAGAGGDTTDATIVTMATLKKYITDNPVQGPKGDKGDPGKDGAKGDQGLEGDSAYQEWLNAGNTGTAADFLASLKGTPGEKGATGAAGATGATGPAGTITVGTVTTGTTAAVVNSGTATAAKLDFTLPQGPAGKDGVDGKDGAPGKDAPADAVTASQLQSILGFKQAVFLTQAEYDALATKDATTLYFVEG